MWFILSIFSLLLAFPAFGSGPEYPKQLSFYVKQLQDNGSEKLLISNCEAPEKLEIFFDELTTIRSVGRFEFHEVLFTTNLICDKKGSRSALSGKLWLRKDDRFWTISKLALSSEESSYEFSALISEQGYFSLEDMLESAQ